MPEQQTAGCWSNASSPNSGISAPALGKGKVLTYVRPVGADGLTLGRRIQQRMDALRMSRYALATETGLTSNGLKLLIEDKTKHPRIETLDAIAAVLGVSRDYLLTGAEPDEEDITTMEALHAWEMKIARQRERYIRAILARQVAETIRPELPPEIAAAVERTARELVERARTHADTEANGPRPEVRSLAS